MGSDRQAAICREMTKQFETVLRGTLAELHQWLADDSNQRKGEFVIVLAAGRSEQAEDMARALELGSALQEYLSVSQAARVAARICGVSRRELYVLTDGAGLMFKCEIMSPGVGQAIAPSRDGEESPGSTGQGAR